MGLEIVSHHCYNAFMDKVINKIKDGINKIDGMEVWEGLTEDQKSELLSKEFLLDYKPLDESPLSEDIRKLQRGLRKIPSDFFLSEIAHSMLSAAVKTQMDSQPSV